MGAMAVSDRDGLRDERGLDRPPADEDIELIPDNGDELGMWCAMRLGSLGMPPAPQDFWTSRAQEIRDLRWDLIDWAYVREQLGAVARSLEEAPTDSPEVVLPGRTARERVFIERWFGYGRPCCAARLKGSRAQVFSGAHRIRAFANYAIGPDDAQAIGLTGTSFGSSSPLPPDTMVPVLVC